MFFLKLQLRNGAFLLELCNGEILGSLSFLVSDIDQYFIFISLPALSLLLQRFFSLELLELSCAFVFQSVYNGFSVHGICVEFVLNL